MKKFSVKKLALAGMFCALCVVGSVFSFPMFGSKCAPVQHMVNVLCAVLLGPWWGVGVAFVASLLRNILGLGSLMAFPGSMFGALLCGLVTLAVTMLCSTYGKKMIKMIPFIIGIVAGYAVAAIFTVIGKVAGVEALQVINFSAFENMQWLPDFTFLEAFKVLRIFPAATSPLWLLPMFP